MNGINGMNGMRGMNDMTGFNYMNFKRLTSRPIDITGMWME